MRRLIPLFLLLAASLCFIAGYTVGKKQRPTPFPSPARQSVSAPEQESTVGKNEDRVAIEVPVEPTIEDPVAEVAPNTPDPALFAKRAEQRFITLTDQQERSIQAEVLEVTESQLKVRRRSDLRIVHVPVQMLCPDDQAFAAYLWEEKNPSPTDRTNEQMILEEIFGGF